MEDQDPDLLDRFMTIFSERSKHQQEEAEQRKKEMERNRKSGGIKRPGGKRR